MKNFDVNFFKAIFKKISGCRVLFFSFFSFVFYLGIIFLIRMLLLIINSNSRETIVKKFPKLLDGFSSDCMGLLMGFFLQFFYVKSLEKMEDKKSKLII